MIVTDISGQPIGLIFLTLDGTDGVYRNMLQTTIIRYLSTHLSADLIYKAAEA
jgi:hypothetical protein